MALKSSFVSVLATSFAIEADRSFFFDAPHMKGQLFFSPPIKYHGNYAILEKVSVAVSL